MIAATPVLLAVDGQALVEGLGGHWSGHGGMCRCPAHDDKSPSLSVQLGRQRLLFKCFSGCSRADVLAALRRGNLLGTGRASAPGGASANGPRPAATQQLIARLWDSAATATGTLAERYLANRHLAADDRQLRFHPRVQLGPRSRASFHPALLAAVRDDTGLIAVHRTFLDAATGSKAAFDNPKRLLGTPGSGAVRLGNHATVTASGVLGLAEGVETALAAAALHGFSVWAVLGNERFATIAVPPQVTTLVILADNDAGGRRAAALAHAGQTRAGLTISERWPPAGCNDWADVAAAAGGEGAVPE